MAGHEITMLLYICMHAYTCDTMTCIIYHNIMHDVHKLIIMFLFVSVAACNVCNVMHVCWRHESCIGKPSFFTWCNCLQYKDVA